MVHSGGGAQFQYIGYGNPSQPDIDYNKQPIQFSNCNFNQGVFTDCNFTNVKLENCDISGLMINGINIENLLKQYVPIEKK